MVHHVVKKGKWAPFIGTHVFHSLKTLSSCKKTLQQPPIHTNRPSNIYNFQFTRNNLKSTYDSWNSGDFVEFLKAPGGDKLSESE